MSLGVKVDLGQQQKNHSETSKVEATDYIFFQRHSNFIVVCFATHK